MFSSNKINVINNLISLLLLDLWNI